MMRNLLIVSHYGEGYPVRPTIWDALYAFERHANCRCYYINLATQKLDSALLRSAINFDAIIYHTTFFSSRWNRDLFRRQMEYVRPLKSFDAIQVAIPQDEFLHTDLVCDFINEFDVKLVYSLFKESEWPKMYPSVDLDRVQFRQVLAGYIEDKHVRRIDKLAQGSNRSIDIGYRAWHAAFWLGRHGQKKVQIGSMVTEAARESGLSLDISTKTADALVGEKWFRFLLNCKCVLGVEGGSSILDFDGSIKTRTEAYLKQYPNATFEETEERCFPGWDGTLQAQVITPRHFECCLTDTCQILLEGDYNGILKPDVHFIEVKKDYSNLKTVLEMAQDPELRRKITDRCRRDIVLSGRYSYGKFVEVILGDIIHYRPRTNQSDLSFLTYQKTKIFNHSSWLKLPIKAAVKSTLERLFPLLLRFYHRWANQDARKKRPSTYQN